MATQVTEEKERQSDHEEAPEAEEEKKESPEFDVVVYGATGFTGSFISHYLCKRCLSSSSARIRWAIAGI